MAFDLHGTIGGTLDMFASRAHEKGLDLTLSIEDEVPRRAMGDAGRLRQILLNLIGNGVKFTERGWVDVVVACSQEKDEAFKLAVAVSDTGVGISAEALPRLFREFSQADGSISRRFGGSGLGLAISRRLIERMGGSITVRSRQGQGSVFRFTILLKHVPAEAAPTETKPPEPRRGQRPRLRVLIVEDNGTNRLVASHMVERMGHHVDAVADGGEAVRAVRAIPYDLVLMDVMMPEMDGLTATRLIRAEPGGAGRTPIIGLTASADRGHEIACREAGMDGFVTKPVTAQRLAAAIETVMARGNQETPTMDDMPILDETVLHALADDVGEAGMDEVVELFLTEAPRMIERLRQASVSRGGTLLREIHTLASATRQVGLLRAGQAAADLEAALAVGEPEPDRLASLLSLLQVSIARLAEWTHGTRRRKGRAMTQLPADV